MRKDLDTIFSYQNSKASRFTPRELIKYHIEHPDVPITDKDIENLILDFPVADNQGEEYQSFNQNNSNNYFNNNNNFTKLL